MPDANVILLFVLQVFGTPLRWAGTFVLALSIMLFLIFRFKELLP